MNNLLLQLAVAALGQFGGGGLSRSPLGISSMPSPMIRQGRAVYPARSAQSPNLQVATLAATTCLMRSGEIDRAEAISLLHRQGQTWGWPKSWGQRIALSSVDRTIQLAGGCNALVRKARDEVPPRTTVIPVTRHGVSYEANRSEKERFGLIPYR